MQPYFISCGHRKFFKVQTQENINNKIVNTNLCWTIIGNQKDRDPWEQHPQNTCIHVIALGKYSSSTRLRGDQHKIVTESQAGIADWAVKK